MVTIFNAYFKNFKAVFNYLLIFYFVNNMSKKFFLIFYFYYANIKIQAQIKSAQNWNIPLDCNSQQIFNPITQKCINCENDELIANEDRSECICKSNFVPNFSNDFNTNNSIRKLQCIKCSNLGNI